MPIELVAFCTCALYGKDVIPPLTIGPIELWGMSFHPFMLLFALGFWVAVKSALSWARDSGLSDYRFYDIGLICLAAGVVGAHFGHLIFYKPEELWSRPWALLEVWNGLSSVGGFLAAGVGVYLYIRRLGDLRLRYADATLFGMANGMFLGRLGCFTAHDHLGRLSDFPFAVAFPQGARHDLGLYEALLWLLLILPLWILRIRRAHHRLSPGTVFSVLVLCYALGRFFLEYLRATDLPQSDRRLLGHTPAQWVMLCLPLAVLWVRRRFRTRT